MFAKCPHCQTRYRLTKEMFATSHIKVRCARCSGVFICTQPAQTEIETPVSPSITPPVKEPVTTPQENALNTADQSPVPAEDSEISFADLAAELDSGSSATDNVSPPEQAAESDGVSFADLAAEFATPTPPSTAKIENALENLENRVGQGDSAYLPADDWDPDIAETSFATFAEDLVSNPDAPPAIVPDSMKITIQDTVPEPEQRDNLLSVEEDEDIPSSIDDLILNFSNDTSDSHSNIEDTLPTASAPATDFLKDVDSEDAKDLFGVEAEENFTPIQGEDDIELPPETEMGSSLEIDFPDEESTSNPEAGVTVSETGISEDEISFDLDSHPADGDTEESTLNFDMDEPLPYPEKEPEENEPEEDKEGETFPAVFGELSFDDPQEDNLDEEEAHSSIEDSEGGASEIAADEFSFDPKDSSFSFDRSEKNDAFDNGFDGINFGDSESDSGDLTESFELADAASPAEQVENLDSDDISAALTSQPVPQTIAPEEKQQHRRQKPTGSPVPKKRRSAATKILLALFILVLGLFAVYSWTALKGKPIDIVEIITGLTGQGTAAKPQGEIRIDSLNSFFMTNTDSGQIFVIKGRATNTFPDAQSAVSVKGILHRKDGRNLEQRVVYCGNPLDEKALQELPFIKIEEKMNNQFGDTLSNMNIESGKSVPFVIVFRNLPEDLAGYTVEVQNSRTGSK